MYLDLYECMPQCVDTVRDQKRAVDVLEPELQVVGSCLTQVLATKLRFCGEVASTHNI